MLKSDLGCYIRGKNESVEYIIMPQSQKSFCNILISSNNTSSIEII